MDWSEFWKSLGYDPVLSPGFPPMNLPEPSGVSTYADAPPEGTTMPLGDLIYDPSLDTTTIDPGYADPGVMPDVFGSDPFTGMFDPFGVSDILISGPETTQIYDPNAYPDGGYVLPDFIDTGVPDLNPLDLLPQDMTDLNGLADDMYNTLMQSIGNKEFISSADLEALNASLWKTVESKGLDLNSSKTAGLVDAAMKAGLSAGGFSIGGQGNNQTAQKTAPPTSIEDAVKKVLASSGRGSSGSSILLIAGIGLMALLAFGKKSR